LDRQKEKTERNLANPTPYPQAMKIPGVFSAPILPDKPVPSLPRSPHIAEDGLKTSAPGSAIDVEKNPPQSGSREEEPRIFGKNQTFELKEHSWSS
jgi:hypothetical protein